MVKSESIPRPHCPHVPATPVPTPQSPSTDSFRSRSNSPASPLNAADYASYGSTRTDQAFPGQVGRSTSGDVPTEDGGQLSEDCQKSAEGRDGQSRLVQFLNSKYSPYLLLENSGSVARDHLALERTFLAYVRTSLSIAAAGVALVQLFSVSSSSGSSDRANKDLFRFARPLGATIVIIGILVLVIGFFRYFRIQAALISGKFPLARLTMVFVSSLIALLVMVVFGVLIKAAQ